MHPMIDLITGDCVAVLHAMKPGSIDAIVCDPPYELGFMGKSWDSTGIAYRADTWAAAWHALKPGGHLLAFGGSRTFHRIAVAIEDAGFEIRDTLSWLYGSGFPKSLDVSKAIDKAAGAEREVIETIRKTPSAASANMHEGWQRPWAQDHPKTMNITAPATPDAKRWQGWGTALKPAWEPIIMARKPFKGTVAANVLEHGTGAINVDACRIDTESGGRPQRVGHNGQEVGTLYEGGFGGSHAEGTTTQGRWPANVAFDEDAAAMLDAQSGTSTSRIGNPRKSLVPGDGYGMTHTGSEYDDKGGASRFFYVAKASRRERNAGLEDMPETQTAKRYGLTNQGPLPQQTPHVHRPEQNHHPTVKPVALMQWLVRMVTPPGGIVCDPFTGSGTTMVAAVMEGFDGIGIEQEPEYIEIARARIDHAQREIAEQRAKDRQASLFDIVAADD